ncbi:hypothetical protein PGT21_031614 [Puccinia graminis f. sp. tritici]|uniref:Uncharacterized protein n=1 Tax=Puccinia graminis f. sp. tritici TaxID=56615 RepID=A0A5B0P614_PUCGR|nr:hypothetical protein PGT21_031614 [Puccinia graminis f. sp. tritici]KAA1095648.1 hypothetical protein PGTUg99_015462 [Puccinia graminis f. sp. tritici]
MKSTIAIHSIFYTLVLMIMISTVAVEGHQCLIPELSQKVCVDGGNYPKPIIDKKDKKTFTCPGNSSPQCCSSDPTVYSMSLYCQGGTN